MISSRPDPKNCGSETPIAINPDPAVRNRQIVGKDLDQVQRDAPEQDHRSHDRLKRFLWS